MHTFNTAAASPLRIMRCGVAGLLLEYADLAAALAHHDALAAAQLRGVRELVPAARTVLVLFAPELITAAQLSAKIKEIKPVKRQQSVNTETVIDVVYDGADIAAAAKLAQLSPEALIRWHTESEWRAAFAGFAPGFMYCINATAPLSMPRRETPRTQIPAGAVALGGEFGAVYPRQSPGGWQLVGHTGAQMWDITRQQPALLQPGDTVRYRPLQNTVTIAGVQAVNKSVSVKQPSASVLAEANRCAKQTFDTSAHTAARSPQTPVLAAAAQTANAFFEVLQTTAQMLLQDAGREGYRALGVGAAGAADLPSLEAANRAVGNDPHTAALEIAVGGARLRSAARTAICWVGDNTAVTLLRHDAALEPQQLVSGTPYVVEPGDELEIAFFTAGLRGYLAVRGGFDVPAMLGSCATDTMAKLGAAPLQTGDIIALGSAPAGIAQRVNSLAKLPQAGATVVLEVILGPRDGWFTSAALELFAQQTWEVTAASNRVGLRLAGEQPLTRSITAELPSEGAVAGAVQVPAAGQPVLFLADHPVTGGYPVIAVLTPQALALAAQLAPGMRVLFRVRAEHEQCQKESESLAAATQEGACCGRES